MIDFDNSKLLQAKDARGLSFEAIAEQADCSPTTAADVIRGKGKTVASIVAVASALGAKAVKISFVFDETQDLAPAE